MIPANARPVTIGGETFKSHAAAARHFDISLTHLLRLSEKGQAALDRLADPNGFTLKSVGGRGRPVTIRGVYYPSMSAAARALNVEENTVRQSIGRGDEYLQRVGLGKRARPITIDGETYPTIAAASRATGIPYRKLLGA